MVSSIFVVLGRGIRRSYGYGMEDYIYIISYERRYTLLSLPPRRAFPTLRVIPHKIPNKIPASGNQWHNAIDNKNTTWNEEGEALLCRKTQRAREKGEDFSPLPIYSEKQKTFLRHGQKRTDVLFVFAPNIKWSYFPQKDSQRIFGPQNKSRVDRKTCPNPFKSASKIRGEARQDMARYFDTQTAC